MDKIKVIGWQTSHRDWPDRASAALSEAYEQGYTTPFASGSAGAVCWVALKLDAYSTSAMVEWDGKEISGESKEFAPDFAADEIMALGEYSGDPAPDEAPKPNAGRTPAKLHKPGSNRK